MYVYVRVYAWMCFNLAFNAVQTNDFGATRLGGNLKLEINRIFIAGNRYVYDPSCEKNSCCTAKILL